MIDDRDLLRHLEEGGPDLYERPAPPALDLDAITGTQRPVRTAQPSRGWRLPAPLLVGGAAVCVAVGVLAGATLFGDGPAPAPRIAASTPPTTAQPPGREVTLARFGDHAPPAAQAQASVFRGAGGRTVELHVRGLKRLSKGAFYELWVLGRGTRMISLGIVRVDATGSADVEMPLPVSLRRFPVFDLSLEPGDGNPTHSGDSLLRSAATA
jgi:hypothetical protein